jgi:hypothetical protein
MGPKATLQGAMGSDPVFKDTPCPHPLQDTSSRQLYQEQFQELLDPCQLTPHMTANTLGDS